MNEIFQLIKFISKWLGEESDIFLSSPKCQNVDDLFWATTATILVLPAYTITFVYMHLPRGGCLSVNLPVCRSGWFGIGKSSLLFSQPSLRDVLNCDIHCLLYLANRHTVLIPGICYKAPPQLFCLLMCVYMSWLGGKASSCSGGHSGLILFFF